MVASCLSAAAATKATCSLASCTAAASAASCSDSQSEAFFSFRRQSCWLLQQQVSSPCGWSLKTALSSEVKSFGRWHHLLQQQAYSQSPFRETPSESMMSSEEWQRQRREESKEYARLRELEEKEVPENVDLYKQIKQRLQGFSQEEIIKAKRFVAGLIRSGSQVEDLIEEAGDKGELTPLVLLVIKNRLELAQQDNEKDAAQALDLLYRRIETEVLQRESSLAMVLLNELLNLHDGISHEEWLQQCRRTMLDIFPREDGSTFLGPPGLDLTRHHGPIDIPEEDTVLLRIDFIREVDELIASVEAQFPPNVLQGFDAESVAIRLRQQDKLRVLQEVKDLRRVAALLKW